MSDAFLTRFPTGRFWNLPPVYEDINMIDYLSEFLDGLFVMLSDKKKDIRREADNTLSEFLKVCTTLFPVPFCRCVRTEGYDIVACYASISRISSLMTRNNTP